MIHCNLQTETNKKAVLWQGNRTYDVVEKLNMYRNLQRIAQFSVRLSFYVFFALFQRLMMVNINIFI